MTDLVGAIGSSSTVVSHAAASTQVSGSSSAAQAAVATPLQNPRVIQDPVAGFITEYLSSNGSIVVNQTPSAVTVAYLRQGLTSSGLPRSAAASASA